MKVGTCKTYTKFSFKSIHWAGFKIKSLWSYYRNIDAALSIWMYISSAAIAAIAD